MFSATATERITFAVPFWSLQATNIESGFLGLLGAAEKMQIGCLLLLQLKKQVTHTEKSNTRFSFKTCLEMDIKEEIRKYMQT